MTITKTEIRPGAYYDSVVLMQLQRSLAALDGVDDAGVVMATPANLELLADSDLLTTEGKAGNPDDLLIVVRADSEEDASSALGQVDELLTQRSSSGPASEYRFRSIEGAAKALPDSKWLLISVPGRYAADVAHEALDNNQHVFLYSDNVSVEDEVALKQAGREKGLLVMGPDCGTAIINGIGLGFANRVRRGPIGVVGASGTGTQAITVDVHNLGSGISHAIGTGGRDLKSDVGAITALQALEFLKTDEDTKVIVLVSKPPSPDVATKLLAAAQDSDKPVVVNFIGFPPPAEQIGNLHFARTLSEAAAIAVELTNKEVGKQEISKQGKGYLRGLFSGGTLAYEALLSLQAVLSPIYSNVPFTKEQEMEDPLNSVAHTIIDLGEDVFTVGRLHPMMDNDLRIRRLHQEAEDEETGLILLDVVLGEGSHADPASELAPVIDEIKQKRSDLEVVAIVVGTDEDPQDTSAQIEQLEKAGSTVFRSTTEAAIYISNYFAVDEAEEYPPVSPEGFDGQFSAINVGLASFYESLSGQGAQTVHVDWKPPASGNQELADILAKMKG